MAITAAVGLVLGVLIAQFFRAFVLPMATLLALLFVVGADLLSGRSLVHIMIECLSVSFALQCGFLLGILLQGFTIPAGLRSDMAGSVGLRSRLPASKRR
jgi:uncharacterized membrane protein YbjE (DUF340 family)